MPVEGGGAKYNFPKSYESVGATSEVPVERSNYPTRMRTPASDTSMTNRRPSRASLWEFGITPIPGRCARTRLECPIPLFHPRTHHRPAGSPDLTSVALPLSLPFSNGLRNIHPAELRSPATGRLLLDVVQSADLANVSCLLSLVQNLDDLLFRKSLPLHLVSDQPKRLSQRLDPVSLGWPPRSISRKRGKLRERHNSF